MIKWAIVAHKNNMKKEKAHIRYCCQKYFVIRR